MLETAKILELAERWYSHGDQLAARKLRDELVGRLYVPHEVAFAVGEAVVEEAIQETLEQALDPRERVLLRASNPVAYVKTMLRNRLTDELRKWGPREARADEVERHVAQVQQGQGEPDADNRMDAEAALAVAQQLDGKGRAAILLTTRPALLSSADWTALVANLPPPPPARPSEPLGFDEASRLLFPPASGESKQQAAQRLNNFEHTWKRAVRKIRDAWRDR
jgi:DNA-directed RNA polymerase specialized sigma24 family protein